MSSPAQAKHEITVLLMRSLMGDADEGDLQKLNALVAADAAHTALVADILTQEAWLTWTIARNRTGAVRRDLAAVVAESLQAAAGASAALPLTPSRSLSASPRGQRYANPKIAALAACLLLGIGGLLGSLLTWNVGLRGVAPLASVTDFPRTDSHDYVARVVNASSCRWSTEAKLTLSDNGILRKGESLQLVEGIAEIRLQWPQGTANLRIEGPAGLVLTADHGCSLSHGKLTVDVQATAPLARFSVDTPNGLVELADRSSVGISVDGRDVSVHGFKGQGMAFRPWSTSEESTVVTSLGVGESITLIERPDGKIEVERGACRANFFASQTSMYSDALNVSDKYVQAVKAGRPLLYWRFEDDLAQDGHVHNEMGESYSGTLFGSVQQRQRNGNQFLEFGSSSLLDASLPRVEANEFFQGEVQDDYTLEVWIKPNHYHLGSVVSFVDKETVIGDTGIVESPHGLLMEIGGPRTTQTSIEQPGKIRFLHRSPPSGRLRGSSCFSEMSYEPRMWQHVVLVKQGPSMRIYINGVLTGSGEDATRMSADLKLLVGQLDRWRGARMYVGQLDELAFYASALTGEEVREHFHLIREQSNEPAPGKQRSAAPLPGTI